MNNIHIAIRRVPRGSIIALIVAAICVALLALRNVIGLSLPNKLQDILTLTFSVVIESLPFIVLGILLATAVRVWVPQHVILKLLPKRGIFRRMALSGLGVLLPVCECGNVPLARGLLARGLSVPEAVTFLLAAPILNPVTIITTWQAFPDDPALLWVRIAGGFVIANLVGGLFALHPKPNRLLTPGFAATCKADAKHSHSNKWAESGEIFRRESNSLLPILLIASLAAALIQTLVPRDILTSLGSDPVLSVLAMVALAFIVSICSNVDAFFALAFKSTFTPGALSSFLVFGPMIDIKMLGLMRTTFRTSTLVVMTALVTLCSIVIGLAVNYAF